MSEPEQVLPLVVMGVPVDVALPTGFDRDRLAKQWVRALRKSGSAQTTITEMVAARFDPDAPEDWDYQLTGKVTVAGLRATMGERVNLHAAGLVAGERALALVAASGTGKTTATLALGKAMGYLSDETVSIDPHGRVWPYAKPLSIITDPARPARKEQTSPDLIGLGPTPESAQLARMVFLERAPDVVEPSLSAVPLAEALVTLLPQSSSLGEIDQPLARLISLLNQCGGLSRLRYREIDDHCEELHGLVESSTAPAEPEAYVQIPRPAQELPERSKPGVGPRPDQRMQRTDYIDAVQIGEEVVVLCAGEGYLLSALPATLWVAAAQPSSRAQLCHAAQRRHGDHPQAELLVSDALASLTERGLITAVD